MGLITFAGTPAANELGGMDFVTTDPAPITDPLPIVTPFKTITLVANQTSSSIIIGDILGFSFPTP